MLDKATKKKTTETQGLIQDEYPVHHFTMIPHIIDDGDLSAKAFRLYCHLRRVTGDNGMCWKGVRQLAKDCHISIPSVTKYKHQLAKAGLIRITEGKVGDHPGHHIITICSVWEVNHAKYGGGVQKQHTGVCKSSIHKNNPLSKTPLVSSINNKDLIKVYEFINTNFEKNNGYVKAEIDKLAKEYTPAWVLKALERAGDQCKFTPGYLKGILANWKVNGFDAPLPTPVTKPVSRRHATKPATNTFGNTDPKRYLGQKYDGLVRR